MPGLALKGKFASAYPDATSASTRETTNYSIDGIVDADIDIRAIFGMVVESRHGLVR